jgi:TRAP-type uncharacterized transport system substrate-binding protein
MGNGVGLRIAAAIVCVIAAVWLALWYFIPAPPHEITIAVGVKDGPFEQLALHYRERLARHHVQLNIRLSKSSLDSVTLLSDPKSGLDAAFSLGGAIDSVGSPGLASLGRIAYAPIWVFYRGSETIDHLSQVMGKRLSMGPTSRRMDIEILAGYGVNAGNTTFLTFAGPAAAKSLRDGTTDVMFNAQEVNNPNVLELLRDPTIRLMNIAQAEALTQLHPSLNRLVLSQGVIDLQKNIPASDVSLIALTDVVLVRADLHPEMIYLLAQAMKEEHSHGGIFQRPGDFPTQSDPEFPMAEAALDYYKNGPSLLQRYLPFWMINYVKRVAAILVTAIAVVIPLFTYTPRLYAWLLRMRMARLYRRLRTVDARLQRELTTGEVNALQTDLENINRSANILPVRHSDLFFALMGHIDLTRNRLASRLAELRG